MACLNYESTRQRLPAANDRSVQSATGWSWILHVLPFIEEVNLYNNLSTATGRFSADFSALSPLDTALPQLICPSSTLTNPATANTTGGGILTEHIWTNETQRRGNTSYGGIDMRQVGDGLSKTVMIGEVCGTGGNSQCRRAGGL